MKIIGDKGELIFILPQSADYCNCLVVSSPLWGSQKSKILFANQKSSIHKGFRLVVLEKVSVLPHDCNHRDGSREEKNFIRWGKFNGAAEYAKLNLDEQVRVLGENYESGRDS